LQETIFIAGKFWLQYGDNLGFQEGRKQTILTGNGAEFGKYFGEKKHYSDI
jgi:hypothetical protein